jgi:uncharacterized protein YdaU (DUF1376 family)
MIHFYILDLAHYERDTKYLTDEQRGIHIKLCHHYLSKYCIPIPLDIHPICKIICPTIKPFRSKPKIQSVLDETFTKTEEGYVNERYRKILKKSINTTF